MKAYNIIDTNWCTTLKRKCLKAVGIQTVIRYYDKDNSCQFPQKQLECDEALALIESSINIIAAFQSANKNLSDFNYEKGYKDGKDAYIWASDEIGQPTGTAIYFAANFNMFYLELQDYIIPYFQGIKQAFKDFSSNAKSTYRIGAYGSGFMINTLKNQGLCQYRWLSMNSNFNGTQETIDEEKYELRQVYTPVNRLCGIEVNYNLLNPKVRNVGAFNLKNYLI